MGGSGVSPHFTNLIRPPTSFVGRQQELADVQRLLSETRLLTLTGAAGCGKTRLTLQAAADLAADGAFPDGVWWVELSALADSSLVAQAVAQALDLPDFPSQPPGLRYNFV